MKQNDILDLPELDSNRYENIFNVYEQDDYYYYNIFNRVTFPSDVSDDVFTNYRITRVYPWTTISHRIYGTQHLWWLIVAANKIQNPTQLPAPGSILRAVKPDYLQTILAKIQNG